MIFLLSFFFLLEMCLLLFGPFHVDVGIRMLILLFLMRLEELGAAAGALPHQGFHILMQHVRE